MPLITPVLAAIAFCVRPIFSLFSNITAVIRTKITNFRLKMLFFISDRLEPDKITSFRRSIAKTFDELSDFLEKSELELLRSRLDNGFLKDKVQELERSREALLQELGGSPDFLSIEFSIWQETIQTVDLLVSDRLALLQRIEIINSYDGDSRKLSEDLFALHDKNHAAEQRISILLQEKNELWLHTKTQSEHIDFLSNKIDALQRIAETVEMLKKRVEELTRSESTLQDQLEQCKQQNSQLVQQNEHLKRMKLESDSAISTFKSSNQEYIEINAGLRDDLERLRNELLEKDTQSQQQEFRVIQQQRTWQTRQENLSLQTSPTNNCDCWRIDQLETEISHWRNQVSQLTELISFDTETDYLIDDDLLSYIEYWREHPDRH
ncbi:MAG: hypothetical protein J0L70_14720 [Leptolyngbya sp. UWPOB_LEPTO1]|uniref:hypothetical protein n=1 Tax=Leptolyngbya sp. UWPOB_LEPTO1 TaxID=2815653 RepID=UPI001AC34932|nr:hypothetical protein [Leptolyngbya sp. UWPOB_LEPTO1]MBN8561778.1 hypothetical protein [Leptolyngbya sp. UWPOB_LEPTO1]